MCWLEDAIAFLFPEPIEQDMDGEPDKPPDISATHLDSESYLVAQDISGDIPEHLRRLPVLEPDDTPLIVDAYIRAGGGG